MCFVEFCMDSLCELLCLVLIMILLEKSLVYQQQIYALCTQINVTQSIVKDERLLIIQKMLMQKLEIKDDLVISFLLFKKNPKKT